MTTTTQQTSFIEQTKRMLAFWQAHTRQIDQAAMQLLDMERQNLLHAVKIGLRYPECGDETAVILSQAIPFIAQRGYWQEWLPLLQKCLANKVYQTPSSHISLLISLGQAYRLDLQFEKAILIHQEAAQIAKETEPPGVLAQIHHELLNNYLLSKAYEKAIQSGKSAIEILEQTEKSKRLLASCYKMLGTVFFETGATQTAEVHFIRAITMWREIDSTVHLARTLNDLSRLLLTLKRYEEAQHCLIEASFLLTPTISELDKSMVQLNLGSVYSAQQNWALAETAFYKANSPYLRQSVDAVLKAKVHNNLGYVLFRQEKYEVAEEYLKQALQFWQEAGDELGYANTLSTLADSLLARQEYHAALSRYDELLLMLQKHPQNHYARKLQAEYTIIRDQIKEQ